MKTFFLVGLFFSLVTAACAQDEIAKMQVERASKDYVRAVETGDVQSLERLQSPAMIYTAANDRKMTREEVFAALRSDFGKWSLHNTVIEACQVFGDTVVTAGTEEVRTESGARAGTSTLRRFTNVWQRSGGAWVMISRNVAVVRAQTPKVQKAE